MSNLNSNVCHCTKDAWLKISTYEVMERVSYVFVLATRGHVNVQERGPFFLTVEETYSRIQVNTHSSIFCQLLSMRFHHFMRFHCANGIQRRLPLCKIIFFLLAMFHGSIKHAQRVRDKGLNKINNWKKLSWPNTLVFLHPSLLLLKLVTFLV